jgi:hypothetical protein
MGLEPPDFRPVDRPLGAGDTGAAFGEQSVEVQTEEEPVVAKEARLRRWSSARKCRNAMSR